VVRRSEMAAASAKRAELVIKTLGAFTVKFQGNLVSNHSSQPDSIWELLMLLVCHRGKAMPAEVIENHLWPPDEKLSPTKNLKNLVYRLRKKFQTPGADENGSIILYELGCYRLNTTITITLDTDEFSGLVVEARSLINNKPADAAGLLEKSIDLYQGDFLPQFAEKKWVLYFRHYFKQQYLWAVFALLNYDQSVELYDHIIKTCEKVFAGEIFDEELHRFYIKALLEEGETAQAQSHYNYVSQVVKHKYGSRPSRGLQRLEKSFQYNFNGDEISVCDLGQLFFSNLSNGGPIICEADLFGFICRRENGRSAHKAGQLFIGKLTLTDHDFKQPPRRMLLRGMEEVSLLLQRELTPVTVMTRWNSFQYLYLDRYESEERAGKFLEHLINSANQSLAPDQLLLSGETITL
jgi:DNA-binding SARP family transcriptional activator